MRLNAPTQLVFLISLALAILALIGHFVLVPYLTLISSGSRSSPMWCSPRRGVLKGV